MSVRTEGLTIKQSSNSTIQPPCRFPKSPLGGDLEGPFPSLPVWGDVRQDRGAIAIKLEACIPKL